MCTILEFKMAAIEIYIYPCNDLDIIKYSNLTHFSYCKADTRLHFVQITSLWSQTFLLIYFWREMILIGGHLAFKMAATLKHVLTYISWYTCKWCKRFKLTTQDKFMISIILTDLSLKLCPDHFVCTPPWNSKWPP